MTSRVFCDIVARSTKLMQKFSLKISPKRKWDFESLMKFERIHQNVKIVDFTDSSSSLKLVIDGLWNIGTNLKFLELNDCEVLKKNLLMVFKSMKMVTRVDIVNVKVAGESDESLPEFKNLKYLKVVDSDCLFDIFLQTGSLYEICFQADDKRNMNLKSLEELLIRQRKLKVLELINIKFSNFFEVKQTFPFKLISLTIHQCHFKEKENLEHFLEAQKSLKEVELTVHSMKLNLDRQRYFEGSLTIVMKLKNLKQLSVDIDDYDFSNMNFINQNVEHLKLNVEKSSCLIISVLRMFPNLKSFELSAKEVDRETILYMNENIQNLQSLKISKFPTELFGKLKIKNLKSIHVNETSIDLQDWMEFLENNQNVTKLIINFTFFIDLSEDFIDQVTRKLTKLEHIELIDKWVGMKNEIYQMICENCINLKYLKLWNINVEKDFDDTDKEFLRRRNIKFDLYNDESLNTPMIPF
jgi:hypothetical protein